MSNTYLQKRIRAGCVVLKDESVLMVHLKDPVTGFEFLAPPGGAVEEGESLREAALRETFEETGFRARPIAGAEVTTDYTFEWAGLTYDCTTTHFLCELDASSARPSIVHDADYVLGSRWVLVKDLEKVLSYNEKIRQSVLACLELRLNSRKRQ